MDFLSYFVRMPHFQKFLYTWRGWIDCLLGLPETSLLLYWLRAKVKKGSGERKLSFSDTRQRRVKGYPKHFTGERKYKKPMFSTLNPPPRSSNTMNFEHHELSLWLAGLFQLIKETTYARICRVGHSSHLWGRIQWTTISASLSHVPRKLVSEVS